MRFVTIPVLFTGLVCLAELAFSQSFTPVYEPEGVNMPGIWNTWSNSNDPAVMGSLRMKRRNIGGGQYVTTVGVGIGREVAAAADVKMLFTSGPGAEPFKNKWASASITAGDTTRLIFGGANDNTVNVSVPGFYTFIFDDRGYQHSRVALLYTEKEPVSIDSVWGVPKGALPAGQPFSIGVRLSDSLSTSEDVYIRYTTDNWATSSYQPVAFGAGSKTALVELPAQADGTILNFYVLTTAVSQQKLMTSSDRFTLQLETNGGSNYTVSFGGLPVLQAPVSGATLIHPRTLEWTVPSGRLLTRLQVANDTDTGFETPLFDTLLTISKDTAFFDVAAGVLTHGSFYRWRVRADTSSAGLWSAVERFRMRTALTFGNLETASAVISGGDTLTIRGRFYIEGVTADLGPAPGVELEAGFFEAETPVSLANWPERTVKTFRWVEDAGNDDLWEANAGFDLPLGSYRMVMRYRYYDDPYYLAGYSATGGGAFNGETNVASTITVTRMVEPQFPSQNVLLTDLRPAFVWKKTAGASAYDIQVTTLEDAGFLNPVINLAGIADTLFVPDQPLSTAAWYAWRVRVSAVPGAPFSTLWLFKTRGSVGFHNLQFMDKETMTEGDSVEVFSQIYIPGYTDLPEIAPGVAAWIGLYHQNSDPGTWPDSVWNAAAFNSGSLRANNDEYSWRGGQSLKAGTYYVASRFRYLEGDTLYGGFSASGGGAWNGTANRSLTLVVEQPVSSEPVVEIRRLTLEQNFPNPFNPATNIRFYLPEAAEIKLEVLDVTGRMVQQLAAGARPAGEYTVSWDATGRSSGIYLLKLTVGRNVLVRKMTLLK